MLWWSLPRFLRSYSYGLQRTGLTEERNQSQEKFEKEQKIWKLEKAQRDDKINSLEKSAIAIAIETAILKKSNIKANSDVTKIKQDYQLLKNKLKESELNYNLSEERHEVETRKWELKKAESDCKIESLQNSAVEYMKNIQLLEQSNEKIKQDFHDLQLEGKAKNSKIQALEESNVKGRKIKNKLIQKLVLANEDLDSLDLLDAENLVTKYDQVMTFSTNSDRTELDTTKETLLSSI